MGCVCRRWKGEALLGRIEAVRDREFPHRWVNLPARVDPKRHSLEDRWERRDAHRNETTVRPGTLENNRPYDVLVRIRLEDDRAAVRYIRP